eukprot:4494719-Prymnesium_polylepis.1
MADPRALCGLVGVAEGVTAAGGVLLALCAPVMSHANCDVSARAGARQFRLRFALSMHARD